MLRDTKHDLKAALIMNAFLMPGSGQFALGRKRLGVLIMSAIVLLIVLPIARFTLHVMAAIRSTAESGAPLVRTITTLGAAWHSLRGFIFVCIIALAAIWIYSIVDVAMAIRKNNSRGEE